MKILGVSLSTIVIIAVIYLIGAKFPGLARRIGVA